MGAAHKRSTGTHVAAHGRRKGRPCRTHSIARGGRKHPHTVESSGEVIPDQSIRHRNPGLMASVIPVDPTRGWLAFWLNEPQLTRNLPSARRSQDRSTRARRLPTPTVNISWSSCHPNSPNISPVRWIDCGAGQHWGSPNECSGHFSSNGSSVGKGLLRLSFLGS